VLGAQALSATLKHHDPVQRYVARTGGLNRFVSFIAWTLSCRPTAQSLLAHPCFRDNSAPSLSPQHYQWVWFDDKGASRAYEPDVNVKIETAHVQFQDVVFATNLGTEITVGAEARSGAGPGAGAGSGAGVRAGVDAGVRVCVGTSAEAGERALGGVVLLSLDPPRVVVFSCMTQLTAPDAQHKVARLVSVECVPSPTLAFRGTYRTLIWCCVSTQVPASSDVDTPQFELLLRVRVSSTQ